MIIECEKRDNCWTNISSPDFVLKQRLRGYLETQRARVIQIKRTQKKPYVVVVARFIGVITTRQSV